MKRYKRYIPQIFIFFLILTGSSIIFSGWFLYKKTVSHINRQITPLFDEAIKKNVELKMKNVFVYSTYVNDPKKEKKEYEERSIITKDSTIKVQTKIVDKETYFRNSAQSFLLVVGRMQPDTLGVLFDKAIHDKGITAQTAVSIVCHDTIMELSKDTTNLSIDYRTPIIVQGDLGEITYRGYVDYSPATVIHFMSKTLLYSLFAFELILAACFIGYLIHKRRFKHNEITKLKNGNYQMGNVLVDIKEKKLCTDFKETKLTPQQYDLLLLFLLSEEHQMSKENIQDKFWPKSTTANTSMTTAINRLRTVLAEIEATFTIITEKGEKDYLLAVQSKSITEQNPTI